MSRVFTDEECARMEHDPVLRRQYFWHVGHNALLTSVKLRESGNLKDAQWIGRFGRAVLDNIDVLVRAT